MPNKGLGSRNYSKGLTHKQTDPHIVAITIRKEFPGPGLRHSTSEILKALLAKPTFFPHSLALPFDCHSRKCTPNTMKKTHLGRISLKWDWREIAIWEEELGYRRENSLHFQIMFTYTDTVIKLICTRLYEGNITILAISQQPQVGNGSSWQTPQSLSKLLMCGVHLVNIFIVINLLISYKIIKLSMLLILIKLIFQRPDIKSRDIIMLYF